MNVAAAIGARRPRPPVCTGLLQVSLTPSPTLRFLPNPECDALEFDSLEAFGRHVRGCGFYGGIRLLQATCRTFLDHCLQRGLALPPSAGPFTLSYTTNIPRQVTGRASLLGITLRDAAHQPRRAAATLARCTLLIGPCLLHSQSGLSGSSAIACAALNCLLRHHGLEGAVPVAERPRLVLAAEQALGIAAGLQDRVIQVAS